MTTLDFSNPLENIFERQGFAHSQVLQIGSSFVSFSYNYEELRNLFDKTPRIPQYTVLPGGKPSLQSVPFPTSFVILDYDEENGTLSEPVEPVEMSIEDPQPEKSTTARFGSPGAPFHVFASGNLVVMFRSSISSDDDAYNLLYDTGETETVRVPVSPTLPIGTLPSNRPTEFREERRMIQEKAVDRNILVDFFYFDGATLKGVSGSVVQEHTRVLRFTSNVDSSLFAVVPISDDGSIFAWHLFSTGPTQIGTASALRAWQVDGEQFSKGDALSEQSLELTKGSVAGRIESVLYEEGNTAKDAPEENAQPRAGRKRLLLAFGIAPNPPGENPFTSGAVDELPVGLLDVPVKTDGSISSFPGDMPLPDILGSISFTDSVKEYMMKLCMLEKVQAGLYCYLQGKTDDNKLSAIKASITAIEDQISSLRNRVQTKYAASGKEIQLKPSTTDVTTTNGMLGYMPGGVTPILFTADRRKVHFLCRGPRCEWLNLTLDASTEGNSSDPDKENDVTPRSWKPLLRRGNSALGGIGENLRDFLSSSREMTLEFSYKPYRFKAECEVFEFSTDTFNFAVSLDELEQTANEALGGSALAAARYDASAQQRMYIPAADTVGIAASSFTVQAWIWMEQDGGRRDYSILGGQVNRRNMNLHLVIRDQNLYLGFYGNDLRGAETIDFEKWYLVTFRYNYEKKEQSVFANGVLDRSRIAAGHWTPPPASEAKSEMTLGRYHDSSFNGLISDFRIYNYAKTDAEIKATYDRLNLQDETVEATGDGKLVAWYDFGKLTSTDDTVTSRSDGQMLYKDASSGELEVGPVTLEKGPLSMFKLKLEWLVQRSLPGIRESSHAIGFRYNSRRHVAIVMSNRGDFDEYKVYIDGIEWKMTTSGIGDDVFNEFGRLSLRLVLGNKVKNVNVEELRVWNKALSLEQVLSRMFKKYSTTSNVDREEMWSLQLLVPVIEDVP